LIFLYSFFFFSILIGEKVNPKCKKWNEQLKHLREKHAEFRQAYADALKFAEENPHIRETSFTRCRELFYEIKTLVLELREDFPRLTKEQLAEIALLKTNFDALPKLHEGIKWVDVEKALKKYPDTINKLRAFDEKGHQMNVFGEENGEFIFASAWRDYENVSEDHRNICFDAEGQKQAEGLGFKPTGNAVDIIAKIMGVQEDVARDYLADPKYYEQLREAVENNMKGWAWMKTDAYTRKTGSAFDGDYTGVGKNRADSRDVNGSFCAALRVKKV